MWPGMVSDVKKMVNHNLQLYSILLKVFTISDINL